MNYRQRKYNEGQSARNDIYGFLVKYFEKHGYMPSYEEIMDGTDLTKCTVQRHMRQLEMDSLIATSGSIKSIPFDGIQIRKEETWEAN